MDYATLIIQNHHQKFTEILCKSFTMNFLNPLSWNFFSDSDFKFNDTLVPGETIYSFEDYFGMYS